MSTIISLTFDLFGSLSTELIATHNYSLARLTNAVLLHYCKYVEMPTSIFIIMIKLAQPGLTTTYINLTSPLIAGTNSRPISRVLAFR